MYIRTKDGVFKVKEIKKDQVTVSIKGPYLYNFNDIYVTTDRKHKYYYKNEIIKESDTPEELCDGFYIDVEGRSFNCIWVYNDINSCKKAAKLLEKNVIRGFIKTNNSLNFVCEVKND